MIQMSAHELPLKEICMNQEIYRDIPDSGFFRQNLILKMEMFIEKIRRLWRDQVTFVWFAFHISFYLDCRTCYCHIFLKTVFVHLLPLDTFSMPLPRKQLVVYIDQGAKCIMKWWNVRIVRHRHCVISTIAIRTPQWKPYDLLR